MKRFVFVIVNSLFFAFGVKAQTISYNTIASVYSENFDGLPNSGTYSFSSNGPLEINTTNGFGGNVNGWYLERYAGSTANISWLIGNGSANNGSAYSFGTTSSSDRALGSISSGGRMQRFGALITNNTGAILNQFTISFYTEMWRRGNFVTGNISAFEYKVGAAAINDASGFSSNANLDLVTPNFGATNDAATDGNLGVNRTLVTYTVTGVTINPGEIIAIRWSDPNDTGNDDGLAIDDFTFSGNFVLPSTDYFRSVQSGNWSSTTTWETSPTGLPGTWIAATELPTSAANTIQIRNSHTVTVNASTSADQVIIENGGVLDYTAGTFTLEDNISGDDIDIQNGGVFVLSQAATPPTYGSGSPTINVNTGGIVRVSASGLTFAGTGVNASNFVYGHQSVLEYTLTGSFGVSGVTYFPNVNATTIPIFRITINSPTVLSVGAGAFTRFNGVFEANGTGTIRWTNGGDKIFRNGIINQCAIDFNAGNISTAKFIIDGETAELGGAGSLLVPPSTLEIGSATNNTIVTVNNNKTITGDISLLSTNNTYVDLGTNNLTVSGTVSGGTTTSYIRTASSGSLILQSVGTKDFPVGHSKYNPITIHTGSSHDWTVNVNDGVTADIPQTTSGAVLATWNITPSVNPPAAPTNITFYFDSTLAGGQIGADFNTAPHNSPNNVQVWHRKLGWWLASGTTVPVDPGTPIAGYVSATALNAQDFSPYGISRVSLPLPIRLVNFSATKISSSLAIINWELAACCSKDALFELERSANGQHFSLLSSISGSETNKFYFYNDSRLSKGTNYYRLKMMDTDGSVKYSKIIAIVNDEKGFVITAVAPNPVQHTASLTISAAKKGSINFTVYDLHGTVVKQWQSNVAAGVNVVTMDVASLANGMYHVLAASPDGRTVTRFMKQ